MTDLDIEIELHCMDDRDYFRMTVYGIVLAFDVVTFNDHWYLEYDNVVIAKVDGVMLTAMRNHPVAKEHGLFE